LSFNNANPVPTSPQNKIASRFQKVSIHFGLRTDEDLKNSLDNIVEGIESYLNNFIQLRKNPSRQYRFETTTMSKLEGEDIFEKPS
jgi:hypothetical protein